MRIQVLAESDEQALADLQSWLGRDPGTAGLRVEPVTGDGRTTMGVLEALDVVLGNVTSIANFAVAYATWRTTRPTGTAHGARTLVHSGSAVDIGHLSAEELAELLRRLDGDEDSTPSGSS
ncbi:effector-associated constant component EACC1 [Streptomyces sp. NPDC054794]